MSRYVLINGAQHGGWCWRKVTPLLEARGHTVVAPDLPSHGDDKTPASTVTLTSYADRICAMASAQKEPIILLGHSAGAANGDLAARGETGRFHAAAEEH